MDGQMSFLGGVITEEIYNKPKIGAKLIFENNGHEYPCEVSNHCGHDFFYVRFTGRTPRDDDPQYGECEGWHLSMRGFGDSWRYANDTE